MTWILPLATMAPKGDLMSKRGDILFFLQLMICIIVWSLMAWQIAEFVIWLAGGRPHAFGVGR